MKKQLKQLDGQGFIVTSEWIRINDPNMFDLLIKKIEEFGHLSEDEAEEFQAGKWYVEYSFYINRWDTLVMMTWTAPNLQDLANQPEWTTEAVDPDRYPIEKYLEAATYNEDKQAIRKKLNEDQTVDLLLILGKINIDQIDEDLRLLQQVLLEDWAIDTEIKDGYLINLSTVPEILNY